MLIRTLCVLLAAVACVNIASAQITIDWKVIPNDSLKRVLLAEAREGR